MDLQDGSGIDQFNRALELQKQFLKQSKSRKGQRPTSKPGKATLLWQFTAFAKSCILTSQSAIRQSFVEEVYSASAVPLCDLRKVSLVIREVGSLQGCCKRTDGILCFECWLTQIVLDDLLLETHHRGKGIVLEAHY